MKYSKELRDRIEHNLRMFDYPRFDDGDIEALIGEIDRLNAEFEMLKGALEAGEQEKNAMEAELAELRERTRWIPVSERLPEKKGEYLTVTEGARNPYGDVSIWVEPVEFYSECGHWGCGIDRFVTHWMPLPPPPEGE